MEDESTSFTAQLPDQHMPPRPRHDDPGHEIVNREGQIVLPGYKSVTPATNPLSR